MRKHGLARRLREERHLPPKPAIWALSWGCCPCQEKATSTSCSLTGVPQPVSSHSHRTSPEITEKKTNKQTKHPVKNPVSAHPQQPESEVRSLFPSGKKKLQRSKLIFFQLLLSGSKFWICLLWICCPLLCVRSGNGGGLDCDHDIWLYRTLFSLLNEHHFTKYVWKGRICFQTAGLPIHH